LIAEKGSFRSSAICTSLLLLFSVFPATRKWLPLPSQITSIYNIINNIIIN
jgi:hypothetical protein